MVIPDTFRQISGSSSNDHCKGYVFVDVPCPQHMVFVWYSTSISGSWNSHRSNFFLLSSHLPTSTGSVERCARQGRRGCCAAWSQESSKALGKLRLLFWPARNGGCHKIWCLSPTKTRMFLPKIWNFQFCWGWNIPCHGVNITTLCDYINGGWLGLGKLYGWNPPTKKPIGECCAFWDWFSTIYIYIIIIIIIQFSTLYIYK